MIVKVFDLLKSNKKSFVLMGGYGAILAFVNLIVLSIIACIHFMLGHDLAVIENWINDFGWEVIGIVSIRGLFLFMNSTNMKREYDYFSFDIRRTSKKMFLIVPAFLIINIFVSGAELSQGNFYWSQGIAQIFGNLALFGVNLIFLRILSRYSENKKGVLPIASFFIFAIYNLIFPFAQNLSYEFLFYLVFISVLLSLKEDLWGDILFFIIFAILPLAVFFGQELVIREVNSIFVFTRPLAPVEMGVILFLSVFLFKSKKLN